MVFQILDTTMASGEIMELFVLTIFGIAVSTAYSKYAPMHDILIALQYEKLREED